MTDVLKSFINCEQLLNNYSLYEENENWKNFFYINLEDKYKPEKQCFFRLPYFLIPLEKDFIVYKNSEIDFLRQNLFFYRANICYYAFFIHPSTCDLFLNWIGNKYEFIDENESLFLATPSSSFRTLIVQNTMTNNWFMVKVSLFDNIANGSRHIDWKSASGQFEACQIVNEILRNNKKIGLFEDILATGMTGDFPVILSERFKIKFGSRIINTFGNVIRKLPISENCTQNRICSFASYMSLCSNGLFLKKALDFSCLSFESFFDKYIYKHLEKELLNLFITYGVIIEPHCQNMMLEIDDNYMPTGKFYYRDFDITGFDRARFPFILKNKWIEYIKNRLDRTSLYANTSVREGIGISFFVHFLDNLVKPSFFSAVKQNLITEQDMKKYMIIKFNSLKEKLSASMPENEELKKLKGSWNFNKNYLVKISKQEIPSEMTLLSDFKLDDSYRQLLFYEKGTSKIEYFKTPQDYILGFQKNTLVEMFIK